MALNVYALMDNDTKVLSSFWTSGDDKEAAKFMLDTLNSSYDSIDKEEERNNFVNHVRSCCIVRVGVIDLVEHHMQDDFNVLVFLKDFKKEVIKDNGNC